ncbi:DUF72 domain-containing protein [Phenylobacterium sp. LH3H17]|uniref:DUF72 domain-containing protein n=1 Tax=Phenylobacterium sp. LH3H17 TaxID=2903901 RepID=UPI0020C9C1B7|nr:DUF72 domain-containing protein [Phenylobacterium sp. LH3H17]UTP40231.1 DUF72 domain-containing protein [Phenylobacterium sp. LH3H17]
MAGKGLIRAGIGGWTFEPWRGVFYPKGLKQADELSYASRHLTTLEINSTYYSSQKPETFAKWAASTPEGFVFSVKASRFATNRRVLAEGADSVQKFLSQGIVELGDRLGPILWQFMPTKKFDLDDFAGFLDLLPKTQDGLKLRHVVEVRHASFADPAFIKLCRDRNVAICVSENENYPLIPDITADFVYARLLKGSDDLPNGYPEDGLDAWAERFAAYADGQVPGDLSPIDRTGPAEGPREVFAYFIHEGKVRAPAAAQALLSRVNK